MAHRKACPRRRPRSALTLREVERCDLLLIAGGFGARRLAHDAAGVAELTRIDQTTRITASVCTGAILLAATGQLRGRRATTHWDYFDQLRAYGAEPVSARYVRDGKYAPAAGVSAGIDLALSLATEDYGPTSRCPTFIRTSSVSLQPKLARAHARAQVIST